MLVRQDLHKGIRMECPDRMHKLKDFENFSYRYKEGKFVWGDLEIRDADLLG